MAKVRCLKRASVSSSCPSPSPASLYSNRLALNGTNVPYLPYCKVLDNDECNIYFASGSHIYELKVVLADEHANAGKGNVLIPTDTQISDIQQLEFPSHRAEIQSVSISEPTCDGRILLGSVDSYGRITVSCVGSGAIYTASPMDAGIGEGGWAGLAFAPSQPNVVAVARGLAKSIDFYDKNLHIRTLHTVQYPTALTFLKDCNSAILAVTEGSQISIWDLRCSERGGCVRRISASSSSEPLYAICSSSSGYLGVGGSERSSGIFDTSKWIAASRWTNCLKYEGCIRMGLFCSQLWQLQEVLKAFKYRDEKITGMRFSSVDPSLLYVYGLDYEVVCGKWDGGQDHSQSLFSFRGDSRWLGFDKSHKRDVFAGWCESGSIFVGEVVASVDN